MRVTAEQIKKRLQEAAGEGFPVVTWGVGYVGPSLYIVWGISLVVLALGLAIAAFTYKTWIAAAIAGLVGLIVYLALRARVKFCAIGVTPRHFIAIDITRGGQFLPPAHQGLSAIQFPRIIDKELTTTLHYVLGNGSLHWVRFQDFRRFPDNRAAARRLRQAIHDLVYDPNAVASAQQPQQKAG